MRALVPGALIVLVALAGCFQTGPAVCGEEGQSLDDGTGPVQIGVLMPLTGDAASLGVPALQGAQLAVDEINEDGGIDGRTVELVQGDTKFPQTTEAVAEFERLAGMGIQYIVGALASDSSDAVKSRANEAGVVLVSPSSTRPALTGPDHQCFFRVIANDDVQGPQAASLIVEDLGIDEAVVMFQQTGYAKGLKDTFIPAFESLGGSVIGDPIAWENDQATFGSKAAEAAGHDPPFIWISGQAPEIANIISALRDRGYGGPIMTSEAIEADSIFDVDADAVDGVLFTKSAPDPGAPAFQAFQQAYEDEHGESPGPFDAFAYDAVYVGAAAIGEVGNDAHAIAMWLEENPVPGRVTTDTIRFNNEGDVTTGGYTLWEIDSDGQAFIPYAG